MIQNHVIPEKRPSTSPPLRNRRKLSTPTAFSPTSTGNLLEVPHTQKRRFSNVGDAARKLSTSIGWRSNVGGPAIEETVAIGRALCSLYIRHRLKRAGVFNKKLGLTRVRSAVGSLEGCDTIVREMFPCLSAACSEIERFHPKVFSKITRQTGPAPDGSVAGLLLAVGHYLFRTEPYWGKIVAIYSVAGGLAVDAVRQENFESLHVILEDMTDLLEERIAIWISANGGWNGLSAHCKPIDQEINMRKYIALFGLMALVLMVACFVVKFFTKL